MAADNNGFSNMLKQLVHYYSSYYYPFQYHNTQHGLYPYVQPQQQQVWHSYLQQQQVWEEEQQRDELKLEILKRLNPVKDEEEIRREEEIKQDILDHLNDDPIMEMVDQRLVSFLETDDSFLTPWSWNPDGPVDHGSSTTGRIKIESGSFFSENLAFLSEDEKSEDLPGANADAELVSDDSSDITSDDSLGQTSDNSSESLKN